MIEPCRILIVDDVVENIQVAMSILREDNYELSFAQNGNEALELIFANQGSFDLILLDVMMPGLNGFETCQRLKMNPDTENIPVIFLTAKIDVDSISKGFESGGVDYVTKPFHGDELLARVKTHLELYKAQCLLKRYNVDIKTKAKYEKERLLSELEDNQKEMIFILSELVEATSDETGKHIKRIAEGSALLGKYSLSLNEDDITMLYHASPMHDVGKITIPHEILNKPGKYDKNEFSIMKKHTTNAFELLSRSDRKLLKSAAIIAHEHHEKWDGTGYPRGLIGSQIHIYGRIVALVDVFDALTHKRVYKEAWDMNDAVRYINDHSGSHFDPQLVDLFNLHIDEFVAIARTNL